MVQDAVYNAREAAGLGTGFVNLWCTLAFTRLLLGAFEVRANLSAIYVNAYMSDRQGFSPLLSTSLLPGKRFQLCSRRVAHRGFQVHSPRGAEAVRLPLE